jgi:hypothetical protein
MYRSFLTRRLQLADTSFNIENNAQKLETFVRVCVLILCAVSALAKQ